MKNILMLISLCTTIFSYGQIKVTKTSEMVEVGKISNFAITKKDNTYYLIYQDANVGNLNTFRTVKFDNQNNDIQNLKNIIFNGFSRKPDADIVLEFPNDIVYLRFEKSRGKVFMQLIQLINKKKTFIGKSSYLSLADAMILFGKINS